MLLKSLAESGISKKISGKNLLTSLAESGLGELVELEAENGRIMIAGMNDLALMAVLDRRANTGQARLAVRRAAEELAAMEG